MNIYLGLGMSIGGAVEGIQNKMEPGEPCNLNLYDMTDAEFEAAGIKRLPRNLMIALEALRNDELAKQVMGPVMLRSYLAYKDDEWERYHQTVTDWEVTEYLRLF
jgi:glutamine synthetase